MFAVRGVRIGEGMPKICAPLVGETEERLREESAALLDLPADMSEWRVDFFSEAFSAEGKLSNIDAASEAIARTGAMLRGQLKDMPILFTLRTAPEGGKAHLSRAAYEEIIERAASEGFADLFDLELFTAGEDFTEITEDLHDLDVKVAASSHDFKRTPPVNELISRIGAMRDGGADVCKIAVMPSDMNDVLTLLSVSLSVKRDHPETPLIALSMGEKGVISRIAGEYFGSDITFASADEATAPGQLAVKDCRYIMELIHNA